MRIREKKNENKREERDEIEREKEEIERRKEDEGEILPLEDIGVKSISPMLHHFRNFGCGLFWSNGLFESSDSSKIKMASLS